jgi:hypothetical protein
MNPLHSHPKFRTALCPVIFSVLILATRTDALTINLSFDPDATYTAAGVTDVPAMKAACTYAANLLTAQYSDPINVNIKVTASSGTSDFGSSTAFFLPVDTYNNLRAAFASDSKGADDATTVGAGGSLPAGADPIATAHQYDVTRAQRKALGLQSDDMQNDGTFNFGGGQPWTFDPNNRNLAGKYDFIGVALHEYTEIMGRNSIMGDAQFDPTTPNYAAFDLFHYTAAGTRGLNNGAGRFFSFNNGTSLLIEFNSAAANGGDLQDWKGPAADPFNAFGPPNEQDDLTPVDLQVMDVIGFDRTASVPGTVANVSTRLPVRIGDNPLIEGFIVQGPAGSTKKILVRAIGPSLVPFGVTDALANPTLDIFDVNNNNTKIASNDNWKTTQVGGIITGDQVAEINASKLAPGNDAESAIVANLAPGSYTGVVRGAGNSEGTAVVDAYDLSPGSAARLANIATRGLIQPGDKLMIAGFIVQNGSVRVVVSALGPSLTPFGITNALPDTTLEVRNANGTFVKQNDDWMTDQKAELQATGLQPTNDQEAAIVATLPPDQYSALVRGKPEATGTGVVQVFFLQ